MKKKIFVVIGEISGDLHGGNVLKELKKNSPHLEIIGTGGDSFEKLAKKVFYNIKELEIIGIWEVIKKWNYLKSILNKTISLLDKEKPDAVFLVDYVGFNLRFAKAAKQRGIPVYFYVAPQVWSWKKNRTKVITRWIDKLIVLFPFEVDFFARENIAVECFGHPLLDIVKTTLTKKKILKKENLDPQKKLISILPGSRKQELDLHLPVLLKTVEILNKKKDLQFVCLLSSKNDLKQAKKISKNSSAANLITYRIGNIYNLLGHSNLALVASGTATLETAILKTPMIIFYRTSQISFFLARYIFRVKNIGLPNIINKKKFIPELLQNDFNPQNLSKQALLFLEKKKGEKMQKEFSSLIKKLGEKGSYKKTAKFLQQLLFSKK